MFLFLRGLVIGPKAEVVRFCQEEFSKPSHRKSTEALREQAGDENSGNGLQVLRNEDFSDHAHP